MSHVVVNFGVARYVVNLTPATYQSGVFSVVKLLHAGYVPRAVKVWETAYSCLFGVSCVERLS